MEYFIALYEAKERKKVPAAHLPFLLEHLHQTFREHLANTTPPKGVVMIPAQLVFMCIGSWFENWSGTPPLKDLGTRSLNDLPVKSSCDFGLKLRRTPGRHNLHEYYGKKTVDDIREAMERYQRTVQWVNVVVHMRYMKKGGSASKYPVPDTYMCETCIYCFPKLE